MHRLRARVALSLAGIPDHPGFEKAALFTSRNLEKLFAMAKNAVLNINFPSLPEAADEYKGVKFTRLGRRVYRNHAELPKVQGGLGVAVISTSQGVVTDRQARKLNVGGEVLCEIW